MHLYFMSWLSVCLGLPLLFLTVNFTEGEHCCWVHNKIGARNYTHIRIDASSYYIFTDRSQRWGFFPWHKVCYTIEMIRVPNNHRLFSKFTVSTTSHQHLRIASAQLEGPSGLHGVKVAACVSSNRGIIVSGLVFETSRSTDHPKRLSLLPNPQTFFSLSILQTVQVRQFLISIIRDHLYGNKVRESLSLLIKYRLLREGKFYQ